MSRSNLGIVASSRVLDAGPPPSGDEWTENFPGASPGDNGFFHWLRTRMGTVTETSMAQNGGQAKTIGSGTGLSYADTYPFYRCTDNRDGGGGSGGLANMSISLEADDEWFGWDLGANMTMDVDKYSLRCAYPSISPRSWEAEWSDDGSSWTSFDSHTADTTMPSGTDAWYSFTPGTRSGPHRYFRFRVTGACADGRHFFAVSGVEFYGDADLVLPAVTGTDLRLYPGNVNGTNGVNGYLARLRNTTSYLHAESGSAAVAGGSFGRGLVEADGTPVFANGDFNQHLTEPEWLSISSGYVSAIAPGTFPGGYWSVNYGARRAIIPTAYTFAFRETYADYLTKWKFEGSNDGSTWTTLDDQSAQIDTFSRYREAYQTLAFYEVFSVAPQATAFQYFRIYAVDGPQPSETSISSFNIFGDLIETSPTLASGATRYEQAGAITGWDGICNAHAPTITSTALYSDGRTLSLLLDHSLSDSVLLDNVPNNWFQLDWGSATVRPETIVLGSEHNYNCILLSFVIEGSNDGGSNWTTLRSCSGGSAPTNSHAWRRANSALAVHVNSDVAYNILRVRQTGVNAAGYNYMGLSEIEVYGDYHS